MPTTGQSPPTWELIPDSSCTKKRQGPNGPSIHIPPGAKELLIGRGVEGEGCLSLWPQISTNHCKIYTNSEASHLSKSTIFQNCNEACKQSINLLHSWQEPLLWYIQDTSTNGTCINGERVPKGISRHLKEGDRIKLAALTEDPEKIVQ
jgi:pSer/pThr/pTyr-binding forkhead associated (FHA) protein